MGGLKCQSDFNSEVCLKFPDFLRKYLITMTKPLFLFVCLLILPLMGQAVQIGRPIKSEILNNADQPIAKIEIYIDYLEVRDMNSNLLGKVGIANIQGEFVLFLVKGDNQRTLIGYANNRQLFNMADELVGYYDWTTFWVYAYRPSGERLGKAKCIAFRGFCAAGIAAHLTGLLNQ